MKIRRGDKVKIISGKQKGTESVVEKVYKVDNKVTIENVNVVTRHMKPKAGNKGGLIKVNRPIDVSKVMIICSKCSKPVKIGFRIIDSKKFRVCKKCGETLA